MNHRQLILSVLLLVATYALSGQGITRVYPKTLRITSDTLKVRFSNSAKVIPLPLNRGDTLDMGTDGTPGMSAVIYHGVDSIIIQYVNLPFREVYYFSIASPSKFAVYRLHFNAVRASFPQSYIAQNQGKTQFEIPEVYELANIIWALSPSGQRAKNLYKAGAYYQKVISHFRPFMDHVLFKNLDFPDSVYFDSYYGFRENSLAFQFVGDDLVTSGPYYYVWGRDIQNQNSLFRSLRPMIEDFAMKSAYRTFYTNNKAYYDQQLMREQQLMPVREMWTWLEKEFPKIKYQSYKVIFSPLIGATHSTVNFGTYSNGGWFNESVMFVCGPDAYDNRAKLTEQRKQGLMSGIVFTEIDHNYVNQTSYKHSTVINEIFSNRPVWTGDGGDAARYTGAMAVFNEYMTHGIFCLWALDKYDRSTANFVIDARESLMVEQRRFTRFKEFNSALRALRNENPSKTVDSLFPEMIEWCKKQH